MEDLEVTKNVTIAGYELWFTTSRAGGPGGQHVNKTETAVQLHWIPANLGSLNPSVKQMLLRRLANKLTQDGELQVSAQDERSQLRNKDIARERMAHMISQALKPRKRRIKTKPSRAAKRRRLDNKKKRGDLKKLRQNPDVKKF